MSSDTYANRVALLEQQLAEAKAMADAALSAAHAEYEASKANVIAAQAERDAAMARALKAENQKETTEAWDDNTIQFARLLCELVANNATLNLEDVAEGMDLELAQVLSLFDRAVDVWESAKTVEARDHAPNNKGTL
jgi:hypothetical protein